MRLLFFLILVISTTIGQAQTKAVSYATAVALYNAKAYKKSVSSFTQYIAANPGDYKAYYNRAMAYKHLKKNAEAINDLTQALAIHPTKEIYIKRATVYTTLKQYTNALEDLNAAIKIDSADYVTVYLRGITYIALGKTEEGIADFKYAISKAPDTDVYSMYIPKLADEQN